MPFRHNRHDFKRGWHKAVPGAQGIFEITSYGVTATTQTTATIKWTASAVCDGQVDYGATDAYGSSTTYVNISAGLSTHTQTITGLTAGQTYHYQCLSTDAFANAATTPDDTFVTAAVPTGETVGPRSAPSIPTGAYIIPSSIDDTGASDVTAALQSFIDGVVSGASPASQAIIVWDQTAGGAGSTYRCDGTIYLDSANDNVRHFGWGATIHANQPVPHSNSVTSQMFRATGCSGLTFEGFTIYGDNGAASHDLYSGVAGEYQQIWAFYGDTTDIIVKDCTVYGMNGDAFYTSGSAPYTVARMTVLHNLFYDCGRQGLVFNQGVGWDIGWNIIRDVALFCLDAEDLRDEQDPTGIGVLDDVDIHDNVFAGWNWHLTGSPGTAGVDWYRAHALSISEPKTISNITIQRNQFGDASHLYGAEGSGGAEGWGDEYGADDPASHPIAIDPRTTSVISDVVLDENTFDMPVWQRVRPACRIERAANLTITDNDFQTMEIVDRETTGTRIVSGNT